MLGCDPPLAQRPQPWIADPAGIGAIRTGMLVQDALARIGGSGARGDLTEYGCDYVQLSAAPAGVGFMIWGDTIVRIDVDTAGIRTREGVGVGDRESVVLSRYAGYVRVEPDPYDGPEGHYVIVDAPATPGYRMIFQTDGNKVWAYRVGRRHAVDLIEGCS